MHKRDYFIMALKAGCFRYKRWVLEVFAMTAGERPATESNYIPYQLLKDVNPIPLKNGKPNVQYYFQNPDNREEKIYIEGITPGEPPFYFKEEVVLGVGDIPNLRKNITSTYGNLLFNQMVLVYPFGDKIEYMEGAVSVPKIEKIIELRLVDEPKDVLKVTKDMIFVSEYKKFNEALFALAGYTQLCVPSATPKTMTVDPAIAVRRGELLEKYKDRLHDPVIQAKIDDELIAMDKAWMKGDPGEGFYLKEKSYAVVRKKTFLLQGAEQGFDVQGEVIPTSLNEGWNIKNLPAMGNSLREGSYNRGALTALGGEATKFNYRIFQNTIVSEEDCGSVFGLTVTLTEDIANRYLSSSVVTPNGPVELTEENIGKYVGKTIRVRSPIYCQTKGANFCACCIGKKIASTPNAISTYAADIGSTFMSIMLASMHGKSLRVGHYDLKKSIS